MCRTTLFSNIDAVPQPQLFYMQCFELWYPFDIPKSETPQYDKNWPIFLPLKSYVKLIFRIIEVQKPLLLTNYEAPKFYLDGIFQVLKDEL